MNAAAVDASPVVDADVSTVGGVSGPISAPMVAALEGAWAAIRARHPEVPAVVLVLGAGSIGERDAGSSWSIDPDLVALLETMAVARSRSAAARAGAALETPPGTDHAGLALRPGRDSPPGGRRDGAYPLLLLG